jgi:hypothetical protein
LFFEKINKIDKSLAKLTKERGKGPKLRELEMRRRHNKYQRCPEDHKGIL